VLFICKTNALEVVGVVVMESSLARLGSDSSRIFFLLLEKLKPKNRLSLIGSTEKNSGLKSLIFHDLQSAF
jgi:hypothetical protein